jgi:tRNA pseudouridine38-40 synthase
MANYKLILEYDGTRYHGWQYQATQPTVEAELRQALRRVTGQEPKLVAAGRTDAGVHALGQCVNFQLAGSMEPDRLPAALNAHLPADIVVRAASRVEDTFHARYSARARHYRYRLSDRLTRPAIGRQYLWYVRRPLDVDPMQTAARALLGRHDLVAFGRSPLPGGSTLRTIHSLEVQRQGDLIEVDAVADAFLYGMMRRLVGALVAVGLGRLAPARVAEALLSGTPLPVSAPAWGLVQVAVRYPEALAA